LQRSADLDVTRYSALEVTNVQLRRQVEQLELLCKEQAAAAQQLTKRQQENQLCKVVDKNAELTIENSDTKKQVQELFKLRLSFCQVDSSHSLKQNARLCVAR